MHNFGSAQLSGFKIPQKSYALKYKVEVVDFAKMLSNEEVDEVCNARRLPVSG